jgi:hypothetical protein
VNYLQAMDCLFRPIWVHRLHAGELLLPHHSNQPPPPTLIGQTFLKRQRRSEETPASLSRGDSGGAPNPSRHRRPSPSLPPRRRRPPAQPVRRFMKVAAGLVHPALPPAPRSVRRQWPLRPAAAPAWGGRLWPPLTLAGGARARDGSPGPLPLP